MPKSVFSIKIKLIIFLINFFTLITIGFLQYTYQLNDLEKEFNYNIENIIKKEFSNNISTTKGVITSLSSYYQTTEDMNPSSFSNFSKDLLNSYKYMKAIGFATIVSNNEKVSFEEDMRDSGLYNFYIKNYQDKKLIKSEDKNERYAPIIYIEPSSYLYTRFYGFDLYSNDILNKALSSISKYGNVAIKDRVFDGLGNMMHLFIKATYKGSGKIKDNKTRVENVNGFYIINIDLSKLLENIKKKFPSYKISISDYHSLEKFDDSKIENIFLKNLVYQKKLKGFEHSFLSVSKKLTMNDFNFVSFFLVIFLVILIQILYVLIWHKDKVSKNELSYKASHDDLTGLTNRDYFRNEFDKKINKHKYLNNLIAVVFIDLDRFKEINDSFGHKFGDEVLIEVSKRFKSVMRNNDIICRHGGDEFLILIDDIKNIDNVINIVKKIMKSISEPINFNLQKIHLTVSIGISLFPNDGNTVDDLLKNADSAMYKAKNEGRNTFKFYTEDMTLEVMQKIVMENKLREAITNDEFIVYFQPQYDGSNDKLIGMEALVRWQNSKGEIIPPFKFIPIAEDADLIIELDRLVMKKAIKQFSIWKKQDLFNGTLSLNLSIKQLKNDDFVNLLNTTILENNCKQSDIELEVTEGGIMENPAESIEKLEDISSLGIKLSVDDFGTGYSSLAYLKKLPINKLKIDRAFVKDLPLNEEDIAISKAVIALAKSLKLDVIAEGVETLEQRDFLVKNGCHKIQGYFYGKPMPSNEFEELFTRNK